jgi:hypothetical protein
VKLLNAGKPSIVEADEAENVRRQVAVGIAAFRLLQRIDAIDVQRRNRATLRIGRLSCDPDEVTRRATAQRS